MYTPPQNPQLLEADLKEFQKRIDKMIESIAGRRGGGGGVGCKLNNKQKESIDCMFIIVIRDRLLRRLDLR